MKGYHPVNISMKASPDLANSFAWEATAHCDHTQGSFCGDLFPQLDFWKKMKDHIWTSKVALSRSTEPLHAICSIFWNLKVKGMNKNTCNLLAISHCRGRSGQAPSLFVSGYFFEPWGQKSAKSIINTTWIFLPSPVCDHN